MRTVTASIIALNLVFTALAWSQTSDARSPGIPSNFNSMRDFRTSLREQTVYFNRLPGISPDYRLGPGDVIEIDVIGSETLNQSFKISNSGNITFLLLGDIKAAGLTAEELEADIAARLNAKGLVKDPEVLLYIESYEAKPIYIVGEVDNPGEYLMSQQLTLMDAIFISGGLDFSSDRYGFLYRRNRTGEGNISSNGQEPVRNLPLFNVQVDGMERRPGQLTNPEIAGPDTEVIKFDLEPVKKGGIIEPNIQLEAGDVFVVPRRHIQYFYVVGDVMDPGAHEAQPEKTILASQAISHAGGPTRTAKMSKGMLVRYDENGARHQSKIDFKAILEGRQNDFEVLPDDIIFIPGSNAKTLGYAMLGIIPRGVQTRVEPITRYED